MCSNKKSETLDMDDLLFHSLAFSINEVNIQTIDLHQNWEMKYE